MFGRLSEDTAEAVRSLRGVICPAKKVQRIPVSRGLGGWFWVGLFPQVKFLQKRVIAFGFGAVEIIQKTAATTDHGKKTPAGGEILHGVLQVGREMVDPFREEGDLHVGRTCILFVETVTGNDLTFRCGGHEIRRKTYANGFPSQCWKMDSHRLSLLGALGVWAGDDGTGDRVEG